MIDRDAIKRLRPTVKTNHGHQTISVEMTAAQARDIAAVLALEWPLLALNLTTAIEAVEAGAELRMMAQ